MYQVRSYCLIPTVVTHNQHDRCSENCCPHAGRSSKAALLSRPKLLPDAPESEKDQLITEQNKTIRELETVMCSYEDKPLRAVCKDVENQWASKLECKHNVSAMHKEQAAWAAELEKEKKVTPCVHPHRRTQCDMSISCS